MTFSQYLNVKVVFQSLWSSAVSVAPQLHAVGSDDGTGIRAVTVKQHADRSETFEIFIRPTKIGHFEVGNLEGGIRTLRSQRVTRGNMGDAIHSVPFMTALMTSRPYE